MQRNHHRSRFALLTFLDCAKTARLLLRANFGYVETPLGATMIMSWIAIMDAVHTTATSPQIIGNTVTETAETMTGTMIQLSSAT